MFLENFLTDGQSEASSSTSFVRYKHREDFFKVVLFDSCSVVSNANESHGLGGVIPGLDINATFAQVLTGIDGI